FQSVSFAPLRTSCFPSGVTASACTPGSPKSSSHASNCSGTCGGTSHLASCSAVGFTGSRLATDPAPASPVWPDALDDAVPDPAAPAPASPAAAVPDCAVPACGAFPAGSLLHPP